MTPEQVGDLLSLAAAFDEREVGDAQVLAWLAALGDIGFDDARAAVVSHYQESPRRIMPADIRQRAKAMRRARLERTPIEAPPAELAGQPPAYRAELKRRIQAVAAGEDRLVPLSEAIGELGQLRAIEGGKP